MYTNDGTCFRSIIVIIVVCDKFTVIVRSFFVIMVIIVNVSIDVLNVGIKYRIMLYMSILGLDEISFKQDLKPSIV